MKIMKKALGVIVLIMIGAVIFASCDFGNNSECDHSYGPWEYKEATCTTAGGQTRVCSKCGYRDGELTAALGHSEVVEKQGVEATCTQSGMTEQRKCRVCNMITSEQTVIPAKGHVSAVDPAVAPTYESTGLTEGSHCSVCQEIIVAQQVLPILDATYHAIVYQNLKGVQSPDVTRYAEEVGLLQLPVLESTVGYRFVGWYTASENGERVEYIPKGSNSDFILFAHWELEEYTISYVDAPSHTNPLKYTVEDEIILADPEWDGLLFNDWTDGTNKTVTYQDSFGKQRVKIAKGTTGNIELRANWRLKENNVVPTRDSEIYIVFDDKTGAFHFVYSLGRIEQVKIQSLQLIHKNLTSNEYSWEISETVTLSKELVNEISNSISHNVTSSEEWQNSVSWTKDKSVNISGSISKTMGAELAGIKKQTEGALGISYTSSQSRTDTSVEGGGFDVDSGSVGSVGSSVSYVESSSITVTEKSTLMNEAPYGEYEYACVGTVNVFAVVTYDPAEKNFYLNTYSVLENTMKKAILYRPDSSVNANIIPNDSLDFYIPGEELLEKVNNSYYVKLHSNYPDSDDNADTIIAYSAGKANSLSKKTYERSGFVFTGWSTTADGGVEYADGANIKDLAAIGEFIDLYAVWEPESYTASWNEGVKSTIIVKRTSSPYKSASIGKLNSGDAVYYGDQLSVEYVADKGYYFEQGGEGETSITISDNVGANRIFANASPVKYYVKYNANGGTDTMGDSTFVYDRDGALTTNGIKRHGWKFVGWNTKADGSGTFYSDGETVKNLSDKNGETVTLYAQWEIVTEIKYSFNAFEVNNGITGASGKYVNLENVFDMASLKSKGYTLNVSMSFTLKDKDVGTDGKYIFGFRMFNGSGDTYPKLYDSGMHEISKGSIAKNYPGIISIKCTSLANNNLGFLFYEDTYSLFGVITNRYNVENLHMTVYFTK